MTLSFFSVLSQIANADLNNCKPMKKYFHHDQHLLLFAYVDELVSLQRNIPYLSVGEKADIVRLSDSELSFLQRASLSSDSVLSVGWRGDLLLSHLPTVDLQYCY